MPKIFIDPKGDGKARLFQGKIKKTGASLIGINFNRKIEQGDIEQLHKAVDVLLTLKYGEGIERGKRK